jgi:methylation protein EvaC
VVKTYHKNVCRICGSVKLKLFVDLGEMPHAGDFLNKNEIGKEIYYPLKIYICGNCKLVQVLDVVNPDKLFKDYKYASSVGLSRYFEEYADYLFSKKILKKGDFVVEIGSNDGVFLSPLEKRGAKTLGVDPAKNINKIARKRSLKILDGYFDTKIAERISNKYGKANMITASNVLAHIDDIGEVVRGIKILLETNGVLLFEVHYLPTLIDKNQYDFFYNEHLCYYTLTNILNLLNKYKLKVTDVQFTDLHGGTIRVFAGHSENVNLKTSAKVKSILKKEKGAEFSGKINNYPAIVYKKINSFKKKVAEITEKGEILVGYGASGRANTIINSAGISRKEIKYVVDDSPLRAGKYMPGSHIPVKSLDFFLKDEKAKHLILFAWAYKNQILAKIELFVKRGGNIIKP